MEAWASPARGEFARIPRQLLRWTGVPARDCARSRGGSPRPSCRSGRRSLLTLALVTALGPLLYRIAYQPLAEASVLVLLIVSVAVHFALTGLGLWFFGAEGSRTPPFSSASFDVGGITVSVQSLLVVATSVALIAALVRLLRAHALRQGAARDGVESRRRAACAASRRTSPAR